MERSKQNSSLQALLCVDSNTKLKRNKSISDTTCGGTDTHTHTLPPQAQKTNQAVMKY